MNDEQIDWALVMSSGIDRFLKAATALDQARAIRELALTNERYFEAVVLPSMTVGRAQEGS